MARSRVQSIRSNVSGARPANQEPGTIYTNWADRQIGVADAARQPMDMVAVRYFATTASYTPGQLVVQNGKVYRATAVISPGAFDLAKWQEISVQSGSGIWIGADPPPGVPVPGQLWWESDSGDLFVWYDDGDSAQWVQINTTGVTDRSSLYYVATAGQTAFPLGTPDRFNKSANLSASAAVTVMRNGSRLMPVDGLGVGGYTLAGNVVTLAWPAGDGETVIIDIVEA